MMAECKMQSRGANMACEMPLPPNPLKYCILSFEDFYGGKTDMVIFYSLVINTIPSCSCEENV